MKVRIAFITDADGDMDITRIGAIEDHPVEEAKRLIRDGIAAEATAEEIADWEIEQARRDEAAAAELADLKRDELRARLPDGVEMPSGATKAELVTAIVEASHQPDGVVADDISAEPADPTDPPASGRSRR